MPVAAHAQRHLYQRPQPVSSCLGLTWPPCHTVTMSWSREGFTAISSPGEYTTKYSNIKTIDYEASLTNLQRENATLRQENEKVKQVVAL